MTNWLRIFLIRVAILSALLAVWEFVSGRFISEFFISSPSEVWKNLFAWLRSGELLRNAAITAIEAFSGFLIGAAAGISMGILLGRNRQLADILKPFITAFYSLPKVALAPLFILWFGIGMDMKIYLVAVVVFFLVFLSTYEGVRQVDDDLIAILRLMGANERHVLTKIVMPSAFTWVFSGLKISVPYALIGAIVGEMMAANRGLGYLLADSAGQFNTAGVFAALVAIVCLSFILNYGVSRLERLAMPWNIDRKHRDPAL